MLDPTGSGLWDGFKMIINLVQKPWDVGGDKFLKTLTNLESSRTIYNNFKESFSALYPT